MKNFEMTFTDHIEATRRAAEMVAEGVTAKYMGLWDGLYVVEYQANERLPEHTLHVAPEPEPEMQYINRRDFMPDGVTRGDGALWPTMFPITSPGWVQIGCRPCTPGYHSEGDTVVVYGNHLPRPIEQMTKRIFSGRLSGTPARVWIKKASYDENTLDVFVINFSKGDHLSESEREAWHQEATGFQDSYYSTFKP